MDLRVPVSVIVPHHNRSDLIGFALSSIRQQTLQPTEILIVDDASSPEHRDRLAQYADFARVIYLEKNRGPAYARNAGIQAAKCDFLAFLDDDDLWEPNKLEVQWKILNDNPHLSAVTSAMIVFGDDGRPTRVIEGHSPEIMTVEAALEATIALIQTLLIRTPVMRALNGFDVRCPPFEDQEFWIRLTAAGYQAMHLRQPLLRLRRGSHKSLTSNWWSYIRGHLRVVVKHRRLYRQVMGPGAVRMIASLYIRRSGFKAGGVIGRIVYAIGCIVGGELRPLARLIATGKLTWIPYSRDGEVVLRP
jgi:glycosyltransferase involved in cell wall biosynthesis